MGKNKSRSGGRSSRGLFLFSGDFWAHTFFKVLIAALVVAGGWVALEIARNHAIKLSDFQISPSNLKILSKPAWVTGPIEKEVADIPAKEERISLLDRKATDKVAAGLRANPWVKDVKSVIREFPDRMRAKVELRDPAAFVLRSGRYYIVDASACRLPGEYLAPSEAGLNLLLVVYVRTAPSEPGHVWNDPAVIEGAKLAEFLKKHDDVVKAARITAIDTSNIGGRRTPRESDITLITEDQVKILWGKGVSTPLAKELSPESKIANLKAVLQREGGISDKEYVDIRFQNPVYRDRKYLFGSL